MNKKTKSPFSSVNYQKILTGCFLLFITSGLFGQHYHRELSIPIVFEGNDSIAYRDPAALFNEEGIHLFFTLVEIENDGKIFSYTAYSNSKDLKNWSPVIKLTPRDQILNFCSPGNVIKYKDDWVLCLQTYPRSGYKLSDGIRYGDKTARIFIMRSKDLINWSDPELLRVKGNDIREEDMGRMIDPYLFRDSEETEKIWCFYKQNGVSMSWSYDLKNWEYVGHTESGENVSIIKDGKRFFLFHSPENGIGIKKSKNLENWKDWGELITLGQKNWPWAKGRITAGALVENPYSSGKKDKYLMFFHGSGPKKEKEGDFDKNSSIGIAWTGDFKNWYWPGKD